VKIYTRTGDDGTTGLLGGDRIKKDSLRIQAIGDVDELNTVVGFARIHSATSKLDHELAEIQNWLFDLGAELACLPGGKFDIRTISERHISRLEQSIDLQTAELPPLKVFILPGGTALGATLHQARAVCRRAERSVLALGDDGARPETAKFLNRLSDWFFTAARTANLDEGVLDIAWKKSEEI
jgi:cob(I)alamin adenosyltransferase